MHKKKLVGTAATLMAFLAVFVDAALASEGRRWPFDVPLFFLALPLLLAAHRLLRPTPTADELAAPPAGTCGEPRGSAAVLVAPAKRRSAGRQMRPRHRQPSAAFASTRVRAEAHRDRSLN